MIVSIVTRSTGAPPAEWKQRTEVLLPRLLALLRRQPGFVSLEMLRAADGRLVEITRWETAEDCRRYVRGGAAATAAALSDAVFPTAAYPNGAWVRRTFEVIGA